MDRVWDRPGPASEVGALIVAHCLSDLVLGVHHEGPVLGHGLTDRTALKKEYLGVGRASPLWADAEGEGARRSGPGLCS